MYCHIQWKTKEDKRKSQTTKVMLDLILRASILFRHKSHLWLVSLKLQHQLLTFELLFFNKIFPNKVDHHKGEGIFWNSVNLRNYFGRSVFKYISLLSHSQLYNFSLLIWSPIPTSAKLCLEKIENRNLFTFMFLFFKIF